MKIDFCRGSLGSHDAFEACLSGIALDLRPGRRILPKMLLDQETPTAFDHSITEVSVVPQMGQWVTWMTIWRGGP